EIYTLSLHDALPISFWMIMTLQSLGRDYIVWDKAGTIDFLKPGRGTVVADFRLDEAVLDTMRAATADGGRHLHWFETDIVDAQGDRKSTRLNSSHVK